MALDHSILGLLESPLHGYDVARLLAERYGPAWRVDFGQLYRLLRAMEERGWVHRRAAKSSRGPQRWIYRRTPAGRRELDRWLDEPRTDPHAHRDEFPVKLSVALALRPAAVAGLLEERRRQLAESIEWEDERLAAARRRGDVALVFAVECRRRAIEGEIAALDAWSTARPADHGLTVVGSDDPLLSLLLGSLPARRTAVTSMAVGSLSGLLALRERRAQVAGVHLLDAVSGEYNVPFVRHLLPEHDVILVRLARREQGLMVAPGNPKNVRNVRDLRRPRVRLMNRQPGAGTRLLLDTLLRRAGARSSDVAGWRNVADTHEAVAAAVHEGRADVGVGLRCVAEAHGLDFVPLAMESYDLALTAETYASPGFAAVRRVLASKAFRRRAGALPGYEVREMGEVVARLGEGA